MSWNVNESTQSAESNKPQVFDFKAYTKRYREEHPEKALLWRIHSAIKFLQANGYVVTEAQNAESK